MNAALGFILLAFAVIMIIVVHKGIGTFYHSFVIEENRVVKLDSKADIYYKYNNAAEISLKDREKIDELISQDKIEIRPDFSIITNGDSTFAENAGVKWSLLGSLITVITAIFIAMPLGIAAGVYIEEFVKNRFVASSIDMAINNLSSIPSVIYGVVALYVLIGTFSLPRSSFIVAAFTLTLMAVPLIYVSTRQALASIPLSIKNAGLGLGLSHTQVVTKILLPIALPKITTGVIMAIARIFGEAAPLILVGSVAFIANAPSKILDPIPLMPTQIYLWTQNIDTAFIEKSFGAIIILLFINLMVSIVSQRLTNKSEGL